MTSKADKLKVEFKNLKKTADRCECWNNCFNSSDDPMGCGSCVSCPTGLCCFIMPLLLGLTYVTHLNFSNYSQNMQKILFITSFVTGPLQFLLFSIIFLRRINHKIVCYKLPCLIPLFSIISFAHFIVGIMLSYYLITNGIYSTETDIFIRPVFIVSPIIGYVVALYFPFLIIIGFVFFLYCPRCSKEEKIQNRNLQILRYILIKEANKYPEINKFVDNLNQNYVVCKPKEKSCDLKNHRCDSKDPKCDFVDNRCDFCSFIFLNNDKKIKSLFCQHNFHEHCLLDPYYGPWPYCICMELFKFRQYDFKFQNIQLPINAEENKETDLVITVTQIVAEEYEAKI